jgi:hypothetical protein
MLKLILVSFFLFSSSCSSNKLISLPDWYLNPPQNDNITLYGVGYGSDLKNSEQNALDNLSQKIIVSISSSMEISKQENSYNKKANFSESSRQQIKSKVAQISFINFKNDKSAVFNNQIYSLVSINRQELINQYEEKVNYYTDKINQISSQQKNKTLIEQKADFLQIEKLINKAEKDLNILNAIVLNREKTAKYKSKFKQLKLAHIKLNNALSIYIDSDKKSQKIAAVISTAFAKNGIKINENKQSNNDEIIIKISSTKNKQFLYGSYLIKSEINIAFLSNKNQIIKNSIMRASGSSVISYTEADNNQARIFAKKISKKNNIFEMLGFN